LKQETSVQPEEEEPMETLIIAGLLALGLTALLRVLFPTRSQPPQPPQIIYVQAKPAPSSGGWGCLPLLLVGIALVLVLLSIVQGV
jgi:hypothetical protein